jgi:hypothetical protein
MTAKVYSLSRERFMRLALDPKVMLEALFGGEIADRYLLESEGQSSKQQPEPDPSEPDPVFRLIPFPSKRHEPDSSTS